MWWENNALPIITFQNLCPTNPKATSKILIIDFLIYQYGWDGTVQIISKEICSIPRFNETNISPWVALQLDQILIHPLHISFQIINTSKYIHTENTLRWTAKHILEKFRFFVYIVHILQRCKTFFDKFKVSRLLRFWLDP